MRLRLVVTALLTCGGLLATTGVASASEIPADVRAQVSAVVNQPEPGNRCSGHVRLVWSHDLQAAAPDVAAKGLRVVEVAYGVLDGSCDVGVRSDIEPRLACTAVLHGREHLAGVGHATGAPLMGDADGVFGDYRDPRCADVLVLLHDDAIDAVWRRTSSRTYVTCRRVTAASQACTSYHRGRLRKTWDVRVHRDDRVSARVVAAIA